MAEPRTHFHLFAYGTLRRGGTAVSLLKDAEYVCSGSVSGILYDIDGEYRALMLYEGQPRIEGDVWRCPNDLLATLDAFEGVDDGLFRRVGVSVQTENSEEIACWVYVAGPALSRKLIPAARI